MAETTTHEARTRLLLPDGALSEATICYSTRPPWEVSLRAPYLEGRTFRGTDLFAALQSLRGELEGLGIIICCNGARKDAWPSSMSRDMHGAQRLYVLRKGEPGDLQSLVEIFDDASLDVVATVREQREFYDAWVDSMRKR